MKFAASVAVVVLLVACSSNKPSTAPLSSRDTNGSSADAAFLSATRADVPTSVSDAQLIVVGLSACSNFDNGDLFANDVTSTMQQAKVTAATAGKLLTAAIEAYCPRHNDLIPPPKVAITQTTDPFGTIQQACLSYQTFVTDLAAHESQAVLYKDIKNVQAKLIAHESLANDEYLVATNVLVSDVEMNVDLRTGTARYRDVTRLQQDCKGH